MPTSSPSVAKLSRRAAITAGAGAAALLTAGCNPFDSTKTVRTVVTQAPPPIDPMDTLIATTRLHLLRLEAGITLGGRTAATLGPLRVDRAAHLTKLIAEQQRVNRTPSPQPPAGQKLPAPASEKEALASAAKDAADAQVMFSDQLGNVSRYRAGLFAAIVACLATHRLVLS